MKTLFKLIAAIFITGTLMFATNVNAQTTPAGALRFNLGFDTGLPTGNLAIGSEFVIGGTARLQYGLSNDFAITFTSGANHFISKINPATGKKFDSFGVIPIKAGIKYFFVPHIYFGEEPGIAIEEMDSGTGHKKFLLSTAAGWGSSKWDIGIRYDNYAGQDDPYGVVALRIAYGF